MPRKPNKATQAEDFFRRMPVAIARSDHAAFLGSVPGEETDEEFAAAVKELS